MANNLTKSDFEPLLQNPLYAAMPPEAREQVEARGRLRRFSLGQLVFSKGDPADGAFALISGALEYSTTSRSGKQSVLNILQPGKWLGDLSLLDGKGRTMDCWALKESAVMYLSGRDFLELLDAVPAFMRMMLLLQVERIRQLLEWSEALTKLGAEGRLAERLLLFARSHGREDPAGIRLDIKLTQELIAELIGTTRQRVNQIMNHWEDEGILLLDGRTIVLQDLAALKGFVDLA